MERFSPDGAGASVFFASAFFASVLPAAAAILRMGGDDIAIEGNGDKTIDADRNTLIIPLAYPNTQQQVNLHHAISVSNTS